MSLENEIFIRRFMSALPHAPYTEIYWTQFRWTWWPSVSKIFL